MNTSRMKKLNLIVLGSLACAPFVLEANKPDAEKITILDSDTFDACPIQNKKIGIVKTKWRTEIVDAIYLDCIDQFLMRGIQPENILVCEVPGSFELTFGAQHMLEHAGCDACICIGAIIGESVLAHSIASTVIRGLHELALQESKPVLCAVLATTYEQAQEMIAQGVGRTWADSALLMLDLKIASLAE